MTKTADRGQRAFLWRGTIVAFDGFSSAVELDPEVEFRFGCEMNRRM